MGQNNKKVVVKGEQPQPAATAEASAALAALTERLVHLGVSQSTASALVGSHPQERIVEALDALEVLGSDEVRSPAGWVLTAVRQEWDLGPLLTERNAAAARRQRLDREANKRRVAEAAEEVRVAQASQWCGAISAALDDQALETAVHAVTAAVPGLNRRVPPAVRSQLLAWAIAVHQRHPRVPLPEALTEDLERGPTRPPALPPRLPDLPVTHNAVDDLGERINALFQRRPDLASPAPPRMAQRDVPSLER